MLRQSERTLDTGELFRSWWGQLHQKDIVVNVFGGANRWHWTVTVDVTKRFGGFAARETASLLSEAAAIREAFDTLRREVQS